MHLHSMYCIWWEILRWEKFAAYRRNLLQQISNCWVSAREIYDLLEIIRKEFCSRKMRLHCMTECDRVTSRTSYSGSKYVQLQQLVIYVRLMPKLMPSILTRSTYYSIIIFLLAGASLNRNQAVGMSLFHIYSCVCTWFMGISLGL